MSTTNQQDDLDAVRTVVEALKAFPADEQHRIIRWAQEKLGLRAVAPILTAPASSLTQPAVVAGGDAPDAKGNIQTFVHNKKPSSDNQFAAVVAYFYAFEAAEGQRKPDIEATDIKEAARLARWKRPNNPLVTLNHAAALGYLDRAGRGRFKINTVGENLVAMTLPGEGKPAIARKPRAKPAKPAKPKKAKR